MLCFMISLGGLTSCSDEDDDINAGQVELLSFGPSGVNHGEQIKFIGMNLDKVTSIVLPGIEVNSSDFVTHSSELIELVVPRQAEAGKVILKTPSGDIESKSMLSFNVPVVIESITAEALPGTNISIKGSLVNWIEEITFNDGIVVTEFVSKSLDELVVTVPLEAQTGFLIFKSGGTEPLSFASEEALVVTLPVINSISPTSIKHTEEITITGNHLHLITSVVFEGDTAKTFVSQSETEIVVAVPAKSLKGNITITQASPINVVSTEEVFIILPVGTELTPKPAVPGTDIITIKGTNLDLVKSLTLSGIVEPILASEFVSHTESEISLALPQGATAGGVKYTTIHGYTNNLGVNVVLPGAGPEPLPISLYDETIADGGGDWSWEIVESDPASTEQFLTGNVSWKFETANGGGLSAGGISPPVDASGMGVFSFSLYGGPGTDGASVAVILNDDWASYNSVNLVEGQWTSYEISLENYATVDLSAIVRFTFKVEGMSASTIFADRVGFDTGGPAPLDYYIYDDGMQNGWGEWDGWGHELKDFANTEEVFKGAKAIKVTYNDQWGALQFGSPSADVFSGYTTLSFRVYAPQDQDLIVQIGDNSDVYLTIPAGWSEVAIPIADITGNDNVGELRIKNNNPSLPVTLYIDEIGLKN